jgi:hypothetical protein
MLECWNIGIMGSGLIGMMGLDSQNESNCFDFLVIVAYFLGRK